MMSRLKQQMGPAGLVLAIFALIAALAGGAIAANGGSGGGASTSAQGKQGKPGKQGKRGKQGPAGPQGPAGAVGPAGPQGPAGANGKDGTAGQNGADGADGESVTISPAAVPADCPNGGTKFTNGTGTGKACNGLSGFTEVLPPEKTMVGVWGPLTPVSDRYNISFNIPVVPAPEFKYMEPDQTDADCPGIAASGLPQAAPGKLCLYASSTGLNIKFVIAQIFSSGAFLKADDITEEEEFFVGQGQWAVTAAAE